MASVVPLDEDSSTSDLADLSCPANLNAQLRGLQVRACSGAFENEAKSDPFDAGQTQIIEDAGDIILTGDNMDFPNEISNTMLQSARSAQEIQQLHAQRQSGDGAGLNEDILQERSSHQDEDEAAYAPARQDLTENQLITSLRENGIEVVDVLVSHDNEDARCLGSGNFAKVVKLTWSGNTRIAIKVLRPREGHPERRSFLSEAVTMSRIGYHPNLVEFVGVTLQPPGLVMECMDQSLRDFLDHRIPGTPVPDEVVTPYRNYCNRVLYLAQGISAGLHHLHHYSSMAHLDIKPSNILLSASLHKVKLTDMGISQVQQENARAGGSPRYMSPETILRESFSVQTDIWSLGMVMYELLELGLPFPNQRTRRGVEALILAMKLPELPEAMPDFRFESGDSPYQELKALIELCWQRDPHRRPKICTIVGTLQSLQGLQDQRCKGVCQVDELIDQHRQQQQQLR